MFESRSFFVVALLGLAGAVACSDSQSPPIANGIKVAPVCPDHESQAGQPHESVSAAAPDAGTAGLHIDRFIRAADQPPLWCGSEVLEGYRALWVPSYRAVRMASIVRTPAGWRADAVEFGDPRATTPGTPYPTSLINQQNGVPSAEKISTFLSDVKKANFWTTAASRQSNETDDGAIWIIEGRDGQIYRIVSRENVADPELEELIRRLFILAELAVPDEMRPRSHP